MSNFKKRSWSVIIAVIMIIAMLPTFCVSAENTEVNLIKDANGALKEGVYITFNGGEYSTSSGYNQENAYDGSTSTGWTSAWEPATSSYIQVNFPVAHKLSKIKVMMSEADYFRNHFKVLVSNDADFESFVEAHVQGSEAASANTWLEVDMTSYEESYRYVRVLRTSSSYKFLNIVEIEVYGYETALPDVTDKAVLTDKADVAAESSEELSEGYHAQNVLDGNESTGSFAMGDDVYVQVDLKRAVSISKIGFANYMSDYISSRINFDILLSNDEDFNESVLVYSRNGNEVATGAWTYAYGLDDTPYRYVRIRKNATTETKTDYEISNYHQFLCISEIKVWGNDAETLTVTDIAKTATVTATTEGTPASYTVDGNLKNYWLNWDEEGKASITYTFAEPSVVTSVMIFPLHDKDREDRLKNMNIYGSVSGDFEDAELLATISEAMEIGKYNTFSSNTLNAYKAIRVESTQNPTPQTGMGFKEIKIIKASDDLAASVLYTSPKNGETNVTNIETTEGYVEVCLNRKVNSETINETNVVITNKTTGDVLSGWRLISAEGDKFRIDLAGFASGTSYEVKLTTGVKTGDYPLSEEYSFAFTTGDILNTQYIPGKIIKNVALNKAVVGNAYSASKPFSIMVDGIIAVDGASNYTYGDPNVSVDLGNYYDVIAVELTPNIWDEHKVLLQGIKVLGSRADLDILNMTADKAQGLTLATYPSDSTEKETFIFSQTKRLQYVGLYRSQTYLTISEMKVYAYVAEEFGDWSVSPVNEETNEFTGAGTYTFSIPVTNYIAESNEYYILIGAYDTSGAMVGLTCETVTANKGETATLSKSITVDDRAEVIRAMLVKGKDDAKMLTDFIEINKISAEQ